MRALSQLVISIFELAEAEGRDLRTAVRAEARDLRTTIVDLAMAIAILLLSIPLFTAGAWLIVAGLMLWLETQVSRPMAAVLTGIAVTALGAVCLLVFRLRTKARSQ
jgi:hypothetical protein